MPLDPVAQRYAQALFNTRFEAITEKYSRRMSEVTADHQRRGMLQSGMFHAAVARVNVDRIEEIVTARTDCLLEAYSRSNLPIDERAVTDIYQDASQWSGNQGVHASNNARERIQREHMPAAVGEQIASEIGRQITAIDARVHRKLSLIRDEQILAARNRAPNPEPPPILPAPSRTSWRNTRDLAWSWGTVVVTATVLLGLPGNAIYAGDVKGTTVLCFLGLGLLTAKFVMWEQTKNLRYRWAVNSGGVVAATILLVVLVSWAEQRVPPPPRSPASPLITMEISPSTVPMYVSPHSVTSVLQIHPYIVLTDTQDGLFKVSNDTGSEACWPSSDLLDAAEPNQHEDVYRLQISNHSERVLEGGTAKFSIIYNTGLKAGACMPPKATQADQNDVVLIPPLDPGKSFEFYAINQSDLCAWLFPPQSATVKMAGQEKVFEVPLNLDKNPLYAAGAPVFSPTTIKWEGIPTRPGGYGIVRTGSYACEKSRAKAPAPKM